LRKEENMVDGYAMDPLLPRQVLDSIMDAQAVWTYHQSVLPDERPVAELLPSTAALIRALSRLETLCAMHPELTMKDVIPPGAVSPEEVRDWRENADMLRSIVHTPEVPATIVVSSRAPGSAPSDVADVLERLDGATFAVRLAAREDGAPMHTIDIGPAIANAVEELFGPPDDGLRIVGEYLDERDDDEDPGARERARELRRHLRRY